MRIVLRVSSSNEHCNGGCEFALLDLTPELARLALNRIATLREQKNLDPDIDEVYYWAYFVEYFSPWKEIAGSEEEVEGKCVVLEGMLDDLLIEDKEIVYVPETFRVPPQLITRVECERMVARLDSIVFTAIPKHASYYVQTVELPLAMLEAATVTTQV